MVICGSSMFEYNVSKDMKIKRTLIKGYFNMSSRSSPNSNCQGIEN